MSDPHSRAKAMAYEQGRARSAGRRQLGPQIKVTKAFVVAERVELTGGSPDPSIVNGRTVGHCC